MRRKIFEFCIAVIVVVSSLGMVASPAHASTPGPPVAHLVNPVIGSSNIGETQPFLWSPALGAAMYYLTVGTSAGTGNVFTSFAVPSQSSIALPPLPAGPTLWATIWTEVVGQGWLSSENVTFTVSPARFINPVVGLANLGITAPFLWAPAPAAAEYYLSVGTSPGNGNVFNSFISASLSSLALPVLPLGRTLWARLSTEMPGFGWYHGTDVTFTVGQPR